MIHVICFFPVADCPRDNQSQLRSDVILKSQDALKLTNQTRLNYVSTECIYSFDSKQSWSRPPSLVVKKQTHSF